MTKKKVENIRFIVWTNRQIEKSDCSIEIYGLSTQNDDQADKRGFVRHNVFSILMSDKQTNIPDFFRCIFNIWQLSGFLGNSLSANAYFFLVSCNIDCFYSIFNLWRLAESLDINKLSLVHKHLYFRPKSSFSVPKALFFKP